MAVIRTWLIGFAASTLFAPAHALVQQTPPPPVQQSKPAEKPPADPVKVDPADLPVSLDRIQRALAHTPQLRFDKDEKPVFRVQVFGEKPTIEDILGPDFGKGPVPYGGMTHQEFLSMVTPKEFQGYAPFTNEEGMTIAATSFALQWALQKAIQKYNETRDERARAAARQEVLDALDALEKARAKARPQKK
jgi:hypothetical protein